LTAEANVLCFTLVKIYSVQNAPQPFDELCETGFVGGVVPMEFRGGVLVVMVFFVMLQ
jgi:hypothetical protein